MRKYEAGLRGTRESDRSLGLITQVTEKLSYPLEPREWQSRTVTSLVLKNVSRMDTLATGGVT